MGVSRTIFGTAIQKGETFKYTAVIKNELGAAVDITLQAQVSALTFSWFVKDTGVTKNSRNAQSVLGTVSSGVWPGANNHTLNSNGTITWKATTADTSFSQTEDTVMVGRYTVTYVDAQSVNRTFIHEFEVTIQNTTTLS